MTMIAKPGSTTRIAAGVEEVMRLTERPVRRPADPNVIDLSSGDPDFRTPAHVQEALREAVAGGYSNYPPSGGDLEFLAAIARRLERVSGRSWNPSQIVVTVGATGAITATMTAYINKGDVVLIPQPAYSLYADATRLSGGEVVWVDQTPDHHLDLDALRAAAESVADRAKMLVLNNPCNPTGTVYGREELLGALAIAEEFDLLVLVDEVYDELIFDGRQFESFLTFPEAAQRVIYCHSLSKTYAMTGWRLGYVAADASLIKPIAQVARLISGGVTWTVQRAGIAALEGGEEPTRLMREEYQARRDLIAELLAGAAGVSWTPPQGAFYAFLRYEAPLTAIEAQALLDRNGVRLRSGTEYGPGGQNHVRLSFAASREAITAGIERVLATFDPANIESILRSSNGGGRV